MQVKLRERTFRNGKTVTILKADLLECVVDGILLGASPSLQLNAGLGKRIAALDRQVNRDAAGYSGYVGIQEACQRWVAKFGEVSAEKPAYTSTWELPFQTVIHTVPPAWNHQPEATTEGYDMLRQALDLADLLYLRSVAISPQLFANSGYPAEKIAYVLVGGAMEYLKTRDAAIDSILVIVSADDDAHLYTELLDTLL